MLKQLPRHCRERRADLEAGGYKDAETRIDTWFERDRAHVALSLDYGSERTIVEWWDEAVTEAVEDGFLDPKDWHGSAYRYADSMGLVQQAVLDEYDDSCVSIYADD